MRLKFKANILTPYFSQSMQLISQWPTIWSTLYTLRCTVQSWKDIPAEIIKNYFLKFCITNVLNGNKDDALWYTSEDENWSLKVKMLKVIIYLKKILNNLA